MFTRIRLNRGRPSQHLVAVAVKWLNNPLLIIATQHGRGKTCPQLANRRCAVRLISDADFADIVPKDIHPLPGRQAGRVKVPICGSAKYSFFVIEAS